MITNKPIQNSISFIHFTIGLLCLGTFVVYFSTEAKWSFNSLINQKESFFIILLGSISLCSFFGALSWQTIASKTSENISYLISLLFLIEYIAILLISSNLEDYVIALIPTITPATFLFLIAFSKINQLQEHRFDSIENNTYLDSDFLINKGRKSIFIFWKPNRIASFTFFVLSILVFLALTSSNEPSWLLFIPILFLTLSLILWLLPKIGSWISSILSIVMGIAVISLFTFVMLNNSFSDGEDKIYILSFLSLLVLCVAFFGYGLALFLLSKEAQQEWKR